MNTVEELLNQLGTITPHKEFKYRVENLLVRELPVSTIKTFPLLTLRYGFLGLALFVISSSGLVFATARSQPGSLLFGIKTKVLPQTVSESPITTSTDSSSDVQITPNPGNLDSGQTPTNNSSAINPTAQPSSGARIQLTIPKESLLLLLSSENESITTTPSPTATNPQPRPKDDQPLADTSATPSPTPQSSGISANIEIFLSSPAPSTTPSTSGINVGIGGIQVNLDAPKIGILGL